MKPGNHQPPPQTVKFQFLLHGPQGLQAIFILNIRKSHDDGAEMLHRSGAGNSRELQKAVTHYTLYTGNLCAARIANADPNCIESGGLCGERTYVACAPKLRMAA